MNSKFKTFFILISALVLTVGFKTFIGVYESGRIVELTNAIKSGQICGNSENFMECSRDQLFTYTNHSIDPIKGQEFLGEVLRYQLEKAPDQARGLKDQYYILSAQLYISSLQQKQKSIVGRIPFINRHNLDVHVAEFFLKSMNEYSNRREVDRTIASETILQEVSNFNGSLGELTKLVESFR